jgi:hypothetical protein
MSYRILSALVVFSLLGACAPKHKKKRGGESQPAAQTPKKKKGGPLIVLKFGNSTSGSVECSSKDDVSLAPDSIVQRKTINLKMEKQRVIRKNCEGQVTSDGMEKVEIPYQTIEITPTKKWPGKSYANPYNRTTCTGVGAEFEALFWRLLGFGLITDAYDGIRNNLGFPRVRFTVDTSPTTSSMHIRKNADNYIDYDFVRCAKKDAKGECTETASVEKGTLILTVNYTENLDIGGVKEVQEPCEKPKDEKPKAEKPSTPPSPREPVPPSEDSARKRERLALGQSVENEG